MPEGISDSLNKSGLGMGDFLGSKPESSSPAIEKPAVESKPDAKVETKPDDKPASAPIVEKKPEVKADAKADVKTTAKPAETVQPDAKPNWDDDTNPWKAKATEFDKRFRDTQRSWQEQHQANLEMQRQMQILAKKLDGTYDPQRDEPPPPDPHAIRQWGAIEGKAEASYAAAIRQRVTDKVNVQQAEQSLLAELEEYKQVFGQDRATQERILMMNDPVQGALDALAAYKFTTQYGPNPRAIIDNIRKQLEAELGPQIAEREAKRIQAELASNKNEPKGIGKIIGSSGATEKQIGKDNAGRHRQLTEIFPFGK